MPKKLRDAADFKDAIVTILGERGDLPFGHIVSHLKLQYEWRPDWFKPVAGPESRNRPGVFLEDFVRSRLKELRREGRIEMQGRKWGLPDEGGLRSAALSIAAELPKGDETRRKILAAVREAKAGFQVGDTVAVTTKGLQLHSRKTPAAAGYTRETMEWRKNLSDRVGKPATVRRVFPRSDNVDIEYPDGYYVLVYDYMLEPSQGRVAAGRPRSPASPRGTEPLDAKTEHAVWDAGYEAASDLRSRGRQIGTYSTGELEADHLFTEVTDRDRRIPSGITEDHPQFWEYEQAFSDGVQAFASDYPDVVNDQSGKWKPNRY